MIGINCALSFNTLCSFEAQPTVDTSLTLRELANELQPFLAGYGGAIKHASVGPVHKSAISGAAKLDSTSKQPNLLHLFKPVPNAATLRVTDGPSCYSATDLRINKDQTFAEFVVLLESGGRPRPPAPQRTTRSQLSDGGQCLTFLTEKGEKMVSGVVLCIHVAVVALYLHSCSKIQAHTSSAGHGHR